MGIMDGNGRGSRGIRGWESGTDGVMAELGSGFPIGKAEEGWGDGLCLACQPGSGGRFGGTTAEVDHDG